MSQDKDAEIVRAFGAHMERERHDLSLVYDVQRLPFPKVQIQSALLRSIRVESDIKLREHMKGGLVVLACYQVGVGKTPINVLGVPIGSVPKTKEELQWAEIEEMLAANNDPRIEKFRILMETEIEQLDQFFKMANIVGFECAMQEFVAARRAEH